MSEVKSARETSAKKRARATRRKIIRAAHEAFSRDGYNATTMTAIAQSAGIAVQTVYFVFHTKVELLNQVYAAAVLGEDPPTPPEQTEWVRAALESPDPHQALASFAVGAGEILMRISGLDALARAAASTEPDVMVSLVHGENLRVQGYRRFIDSLAARGFLDRNLDPGEATDVLLALLGPGTYLALTRDRAWTHQHFITWAVKALSALILR
jgi:AcrR family transcriptional regulator